MDNYIFHFFILVLLFMSFCREVEAKAYGVRMKGIIFGGSVWCLTEDQGSCFECHGKYMCTNQGLRCFALSHKCTQSIKN